MIKKIIPESLKDLLKDKIKAKLSLVPRRDFEIANNLASVGITNFLKLDYGNLKISTLEYIDSVKISQFEYAYSKSSKTPVLYASIYACMLKGLYGEINRLSDSEKKQWADYFDTFQHEDGYFRDPNLIGDEFENEGIWGDGWGVRHLAGHIIIAYARLGHIPKNKFAFLEPFYDVDYLITWLNELFATKNMWTASNYIMNIVTLLQYSRDYLEDKQANTSIEFTLDWLSSKQDSDTGMWHQESIKSERDLHTIIRGAYHYFPLFIYDNQPIEFQEKIIDHILKSQNTWGGFEENYRAAGACEDIDALDPLLRFVTNTGYRKEETDIAVNKALIWILSNYNKDGGFSFMPLTPHEYGNHALTSSLTGESNLFATWFRTLCVAYIMQYLDLPNDFDVKKYPGYEMPISKL